MKYQHVHYSSFNQFKERVIDTDTDIRHVGPMMFMCSDEAGFWLAIIKKKMNMNTKKLYKYPMDANGVTISKKLVYKTIKVVEYLKNK